MAPSTSPEATVYQIVVDSPDHTLFEQEINANLLNDDLVGQPVINDNEPAPGHFTVFAPTDDAIFAFACLLYTSPSPRDGLLSRMPSSA